MTSTVLITGASGGFGSLTAAELLGRGHRVVATLRDPRGRNAESAAKLRQGGATVVDMDVAEDGSVECGVTAAIEAAGRIDILVNNAGVGVLGPQEAFTAQDLRRVFEVNVFGVHRVTRALLPHLRQRGSGLIVNVSSLLGRICLPFYGPYNASKWALEALTENLRVELSTHGIEVCLVEPGGFATTFSAGLLRPSDRDRLGELAPAAQAAEEALRSFEAALAEAPDQDPALVAQAIADLVDGAPGQRAVRTVVDTLGMGNGVASYNQALSEVTRGIYSAFGIEHLLSVATAASGGREE